uniref:Uncharacterized protein n=1 Tax=Nicotiana tabacum TaxID=4097 RepID=A0A1S3YTD1_TOBAC|nr:PREDICTED: uncharacterized protein LOC107779332 [Nicotiana tabacum]
MPDISKYDRTFNPKEHITTYTMTVKGNDLAQHEIESVFLKKFGETLTKVLKIKRALVDPRSSANIIQRRVLEQAKLIGNIFPTTKLLVGFNLTSITTQGEMFMPTHAEGVMKNTLFKVVDDDMGYNMIFGRTWIHEMKDVLSTYHHLLKFPTPEGVKKIRGDQQAVREMNAINLSSNKGKETNK